MILVTGAGGKVGKNLCQKLISEGAEFFQTHRGEKFETRGNRIYCDLRKIDHLEHLFRVNSISTLIHLAVTRNPLTNPKIRSFDCLAQDTKMLLSLIELSQSLTKVAFISSAAVYGERRFPDVIARDQVSNRLLEFINGPSTNRFEMENVSEYFYDNLPIDPLNNKSENTRLNGTSKYINELILESYANETGISVLVLRSFLIKTTEEERSTLKSQLMKVREQEKE